MTVQTAEDALAMLLALESAEAADDAEDTLATLLALESADDAAAETVWRFPNTNGIHSLGKVMMRSVFDLGRYRSVF